MGNSIKVAIIQMKVKEGKEDNLQKAGEMIKEAASSGSEIVVLPEMFNCPYNNKFFPKYAEEYHSGKSITFLAQQAESLGIYLIGGSIPEKEGNKIYNTSFIFDPRGNLVGRHRKIHLFDVDLDSGLSFKESNTLSFGKEITVVDTKFGKIGVAICYDMRFPELMRLMALEGAKIIIIPAAFNMTTGPAHWEATLRMRAIDNQVYVIGASPARDEKASYVAYGNSLVVEPWGRVIAKAGVGEETLAVEIDLDSIEKVRRELPLLQHMRTDIYEVRLKK